MATATAEGWLTDKGFNGTGQAVGRTLEVFTQLLGHGHPKVGQICITAEADLPATTAPGVGCCPICGSMVRHLGLGFPILKL